MFCFSDIYQIVTCTENGESNHFQVQRENFGGATPFSIINGDGVKKANHGTRIWTPLKYFENDMPVDILRDLIGSKFAADPAFHIYVNSQLVELEDLTSRRDPEVITVPRVGDLIVHLLDSGATGRLSTQHGVAWWVNHRLVGEPSWRDYDMMWMDARSSEAKRYTFIVEADPLESDVESDWSGFRNTPRYAEAFEQVKSYILKKIDQLFQGIRKEKKLQAIADNVEVIGSLSKLSRAEIGHFVNDLTAKCPSMGAKELSATVELLAKLEKSRTTYSLLQRLATLKSDDLDSLDKILSEWTVRDAQLVLDVLRDRLALIGELDRRVENPQTDELHELQPLFEKGLWIFGPEYESIEFTSNRQLATVVRELLKIKNANLSTPKRRPDFVALPDASIGVYSRDGFNIHADFNDIAKVFILELKRGGFEITRTEKQQGSNYAAEIRNSGKVAANTEISVLVLGTTVAPTAMGETTEDDKKTIIRARPYASILREAKARTMFLADKLEKLHRDDMENIIDPDVEQVVSNSLFSGNGYQSLGLSSN